MTKYVGALQKAKESFSDALLYVGGGIDPDLDSHLWKQMGRSPLDLPQTVHERSQALAFGLYNTNPLAKRLIDIIKDHIVADGFTYKVNKSDEPNQPPVEDIEKVLEKHWNDSQNHWDLKQHDRALAVTLWGEGIWKVSVNPTSGLVRLGSIAPMQIDKVVVDPENCEVVREILLKNGKTLKVINESDEIENFGMLEGEVFFFTINKVLGAIRGIGEITALVDTLDQYDDMMFNLLENVRMQSLYCWTVKLIGATENEVVRRAQTSAPPRPGSVLFHSDKEEWQISSPDIKASAYKDIVEIFRTQICGGLGIPLSWFSDGGSTNVATASEQAVPALRSLKAKQQRFGSFIRDVLRFQVDTAIEAGVLLGDYTTKDRVIIETTILDKRDISQTASALSVVSTTLKLAEEQGWLSKDSARNIFSLISQDIGAEINPESEKLIIDEQKPEVEAAPQIPTQQIVDDMEEKVEERVREMLNSTINQKKIDDLIIVCNSFPQAKIAIQSGEIPPGYSEYEVKIVKEKLDV